MKKEEVIGKTIITITNNRDKDKTQPHNLQLTMTTMTFSLFKGCKVLQTIVQIININCNED